MPAVAHRRRRAARHERADQAPLAPKARHRLRCNLVLAGGPLRSRLLRGVVRRLTSHRSTRVRHDRLLLLGRANVLRRRAVLWLRRTVLRRRAVLRHATVTWRRAVLRPAAVLKGRGAVLLHGRLPRRCMVVLRYGRLPRAARPFRVCLPRAARPVRVWVVRRGAAMQSARREVLVGFAWRHEVLVGRGVVVGRGGHHRRVEVVLHRRAVGRPHALLGHRQLPHSVAPGPGRKVAEAERVLALARALERGRCDVRGGGRAAHEQECLADALLARHRRWQLCAAIVVRLVGVERRGCHRSLETT
mmetsp:Transcript_1477/g.3705  ORF Transcript_1477/g.3705 Transcript_1477/m.3705 type:complete len:303 (+) Transcript_1477:257-1165(+)